MLQFTSDCFVLINTFIRKKTLVHHSFSLTLARFSFVACGAKSRHVLQLSVSDRMFCIDDKGKPLRLTLFQNFFSSILILDLCLFEEGKCPQFYGHNRQGGHGLCQGISMGSETPTTPKRFIHHYPKKNTNN